MSNNYEVARVDFLSPCDLRAVDDEEWQLLADFKVRVVYADGAAWTFTVPSGFITDLASVPRFPGMFWLFGGRARKSAVLHDWLYRHAQERAFADAVFLAAMKNEENGFIRWFMWLGVRLFGGASWERDHARG